VLSSDGARHRFCPYGDVIGVVGVCRSLAAQVTRAVREKDGGLKAVRLGWPKGGRSHYHKCLSLRASSPW
jgi:hypothetical protein